MKYSWWNDGAIKLLYYGYGVGIKNPGLEPMNQLQMQ